MERSEILTAMAELKLYGMKAAFDEIITTAVKRQHGPQRIVGDLLTAEITEKQARSIRYQISIAKLRSPRMSRTSPSTTRRSTRRIWSVNATAGTRRRRRSTMSQASALRCGTLASAGPFTRRSGASSAFRLF